MNQTQPISLLLCALGGEGGGVLSEWLIDVARRAGFAAQATSIPGVAQRTGATTYYLEVFPMPVAELKGRRPVFGLNPLPGRLDALVSSELLETARQIGNGLASNQHTLVITSSARALTTMEKMEIGDGRRQEAGLLQLVRENSRAHHVLDMAALTREAGTVVSATMLGCIAGSGLLPFARADFEAVIGEGGSHAGPSLRGFAMGYDAVEKQRTQIRQIEDSLSNSELPAPITRGLSADLASTFPQSVHDLLTLGHARMLEYQDAAYATRYAERLKRVLAAERHIDPAGANGFATIREMVRWLALWMAFDDIVRVADLKSRASRWERVKGEVKSKPDDLLMVYDHFKPGAPELAALLPTGLATRLLHWDRRRVTRGKDPWAMPLKIGTHSVFGMLSLRVLASLKWLRVRGSRFQQEQNMIDQWLDAVIAGTQAHWQLGHEIALCGRLIKGYGATNERGKENLLHVINHLAKAATFSSDAARAQAIAAARTAALSDEAGKALDQALVQHGAPARPVKAQPIRWVKTPPGRPPAPVPKNG
ncbi:MAG: indolepyruvate oxidoreductase subunit beta family protein [Rhodoferax sp.]|nr:indolepyruvate oxidoreductase subunit beta family protein [Rhodoferax sp.]